MSQIETVTFVVQYFKAHKRINLHVGSPIWMNQHKQVYRFYVNRFGSGS
jgi:hypothetical protein